MQPLEEQPHLSQRAYLSHGWSPKQHSLMVASARVHAPAPDDAALLAAARQVLNASRKTGEQEDTIDNIPATTLVCFDHLRRDGDCCGGTKMHLTGACGGAVNAALGAPLRFRPEPQNLDPES